MTFADFFTGNFTWWQLVREVGPYLLSVVGVFWAGYCEGRRGDA